LDRAEIWHEDSGGIGIYLGKVSDELEFWKNMWYNSEHVVWILLFTSYLAMILFLQGCGS
jgi:hypothetical protein